MWGLLIWEVCGCDVCFYWAQQIDLASDFCTCNRYIDVDQYSQILREIKFINQIAGVSFQFKNTENWVMFS